MGKRSESGLQRFVSQLPSVIGSALSASVAAQSGDAVAGAVVGQVFTSVGEDFVQRVLSPREEARIEAAMRIALEKVIELQDAGHELRNDGMFDEGAEGDEIFEGVLNAARDAYEEKKLPYIANVFASVAVGRHIDARTAHLLIAEAEAISWTEMCLLALVADPSRWQSEDFDRTTLVPKSWSMWTVQSLFKRLEDSYIFSPLLPVEPTPQFELPKLPEPDNRLMSIKLNNRGTLLVDAMGLRGIPDDDLADIRTQITTAPRNERDVDEQEQ